jgi:hypothetical protein
MLPLYRRLLGPRFDLLPARVRELHDLTATSAWSGRADVERGASWASRLVAALSGLPPAGQDQPLRVIFEVDGDHERWLRTFGPRTFPSIQFDQNGLLVERMGPVAVTFALAASAEGLALGVLRIRFLGLPIPALFFPRVRTFESERGGRYCFEIDTHLPVFGLLIRYAGWLEREAGTSA